MDNIAQIYMLQMQPVSLFPTPGGPTIASTNGSDETAFLLNSQTDMALIILSIAFCWPRMKIGKLIVIISVVYKIRTMSVMDEKPRLSRFLPFIQDTCDVINEACIYPAHSVYLKKNLQE